MDAHRRLSRFWSVLALTFFAAVVVHAPAAYAQDANADVLSKVTKLNKRALEAYQKKDFPTARNLLKDAIDLCSSSGLDKHPIKARTHIHLGIVLISGFKQRDAGIKHFKKALQIQPDIQLTKTVSTPALQDAFEEAMVGQGGAAGGGAADDSEGGGTQAQGDEGSSSGDRSSADGDEGPPRRKAPPRKKKRRGGDDDESDGGAVAKKRGDDDGDDDDDDHVGGGNSAGKVFVGLTLGGGFGIASGTGEMASGHKLASAGFAPAQLGHVSPEVGYFLTSTLLLSLQARFQYVTGLNPGTTTCGATTACVPKTTAIAGFARATYFMLEGDLHVLLGGSLGFGTIRHVSVFPDDTSCGNGGTQCVDTIKAGPVLFGPDVGVSYDFGKSASLIAALNTQVGVPNFTFNLDLNVGVGFKF